VIVQLLRKLEQNVYQRTQCAAAVVELYSRNVQASMYKTFVFVLTVLGSDKTDTPAIQTSETSVAVCRERVRQPVRRPDIKIDCPGVYSPLLLCYLTPKWAPETTAEFLLVLKQQRSWKFVEDLLVDMQAHSSIQVIASILSCMPVSCAALSILRAWIDLELEPHVLTGYVWLVTDGWTISKTERLESELSAAGLIM